MDSAKEPERERLRYDAVLKDLFQRDHPTLLKQLCGGRDVRQSLNVELAIVEERRADLLFELEDESLFLLDIQSTNDRDMGYRIGTYTLAGAQKYKRKIRAVVLYTGMPAMRMEEHVDAGSVVVQYELIDIREIGAEALMRGGPGDLALALLARGGPEKVLEILARAMKLKSPRRERLLTQLAVLAGLRRLDKTIRMEMKKMGEYVDFQKNVILRDIWNDGKAEGKAEGQAEGALAILSGQLAEKFGPLPRWASTRLRKASPEQIFDWSRKVLTAETLEGVVGQR
jgi:predicted transposase YdaD